LSINHANKEGETAGMRAVRNGHVECLRVLLAHNIDVNTQDGKGQTMLHIAVEDNKTACIDLLVEHKANKTIKDKSGNTATDIAKVSARWKAGTAIRVRSGANPKYGWGSASPGDVGKVAYQLGSQVFIDFPKLSLLWQGHEPDLEQVPQSFLQTTSTTPQRSGGDDTRLRELLLMKVMLDALSGQQLGACEVCKQPFSDASERHQCCKCDSYYCSSHIREAIRTTRGLLGVSASAIKICGGCYLLHQILT